MTLLPEYSMLLLEYMTFVKQDPSVTKHNFRIHISTIHFTYYNGSLRKRNFSVGD